MRLEVVWRLFYAFVIYTVFFKIKKSKKKIGDIKYMYIISNVSLAKITIFLQSQ